jgi:formate dehydrogenase subunit gamma
VTTRAATTPRPGVRVLRFDGVQRSAHWATAGLFAVLMGSALPLYFGSFFGVVLPRHTVAEIHLWAGIALPLPVVVALIGPWGARMRGDVRRVNLWTRDELTWLRRPETTSLAAPDKFNPGQKLNAIFTGGAIVVMLASGSVMEWFRFFPVSWRTGATFVHDVFAFAVFVVVLGHIAFALSHRDAMRSMIKGWVTETWAARHAGGWLDEQGAEDDRVTPRSAER